MTKEAVIIETFFRVPDKEGVEVDFKLNSAQRYLDENLTGRDLVPKARQEGVSTYVLARFLAACLTQQNQRCAVISHEVKATQRLLSRVKLFIEKFKGPTPRTGQLSQNAISFPDTGSTFYIGTAGSSTPFGRGDTLNRLHCSEYAYWENSEGLLAGLMDAVPLNSGEIFLESTGRGIGTPYHERCMDAAECRSNWGLLFLPWHNFDEYQIALHPTEEQAIMDNLNPDWGEPELVGMLTPGQFAWRRAKLAEKRFDVRHFEQEYPMFLEQCFQASKGSLFHNITFIPTNDWQDVGNNLHVLEPHPQQGLIYSIGADPASGSGGGSDPAAVQVICVQTGEQVAELASNKIPPDLLGKRLADLGRMFNNAFITVESNNHGPVTLDYLRKDYPFALIYDSNGNAGGARELDEPELMELGFRTTSRSKPIMIGRLRTELAGDMVIHSSKLKGELATFIEHDTGKLAADKGCHDDRVMALACANMGIERAALMAASGFSTIDLSQDKNGTYKDPFMLDSILQSVADGKKRGPIAAQHKEF